MIRFDQRNVDVQATERVFKKVVHPSHQAIRLVDKDGIPLRTPTTQALSRLHSTYVLSPRGVPTKKSNHSYSGQLSQAKMQNLCNTSVEDYDNRAPDKIKNFEPAHSQEMQSYTSMHNYGSGVSSAASSRHYMPTNNLTPKKRGFGSGPPGAPRSVKSMPAKSASSQRTGRYLQSAGVADLEQDPDAMAYEIYDKTNDSPQGKRLEKEWSALYQCRAMKRSSEIVSHRVDRMYFMTGNKLKLQSKYHIEDDELKQLRELSQARASSRASRSGKTRKGDVYRPIRSSLSQKTHSSREDLQGQTNGTSLIQKENADPSIVVSQKPITQKQRSNMKSPLLGWDDQEKPAKDLPEGNDIVYNNSLHKDQELDEDHNVTHEESKAVNDNNKAKAEAQEGDDDTEKVQDSVQENNSGNMVNGEQVSENVQEDGLESAEQGKEVENSEEVEPVKEQDKDNIDGRTFLTEGSAVAGEGKHGKTGEDKNSVQDQERQEQ